MTLHAKSFRFRPQRLFNTSYSLAKFSAITLRRDDLACQVILLTREAPRRKRVLAVVVPRANDVCLLRGRATRRNRPNMLSSWRWRSVAEGVWIAPGAFEG